MSTTSNLKDEILTELKDELKDELKNALKAEIIESMKRDLTTELLESKETLATEVIKELSNETPAEGKVELVALLQEEDGIKIELDWDLKFIDHLKSVGYTGTNDEEIIQKYLLSLTNEITIDMKDKGEFE